MNATKSNSRTCSLYLFTLLFFFSISTSAQTPQWQWAKRAGGNPAHVTGTRSLSPDPKIVNAMTDR